MENPNVAICQFKVTNNKKDNIVKARNKIIKADLKVHNIVLIQFVWTNLDNFSISFSFDNELCKGTWIKKVEHQISKTIIKFEKNIIWDALLKFW